MPTTNRHEVRLTPADTTSSTSRDYLRSQSPSWASLQTALALFAVLAIVRSVVRFGYSWFSPPKRLHPTQLAAGLPGPQSERSRQPCAQPAWAMDAEKARGRGVVGAIKGQHVSFKDDESKGKQTLAIDPSWKMAAAAVPKPFISRPPPAPPLTPPELSTAVFTFDDRPRSAESFIHQPNPDYTTNTSTSASASASQSSSASPPAPRRRSYNKTLPIGIPVPQRQLTSEADAADLTLSPSSYPPTSPLLPPAPPGMQGPHGERMMQREIGVQGEIISVLDGEGAGWTRHTRVYGGGVCLACAASGGEHGGFYGATVRPEEMR